MRNDDTANNYQLEGGKPRRFLDPRSVLLPAALLHHALEALFMYYHYWTINLFS
jgi:hypothetical protein